VDVEDLATHADDDTSCIVFNNPSNPCGSVYSRRHLREILRVAERLRLPIIADEIYADFVSYSVWELSEKSRSRVTNGHKDGEAWDGCPFPLEIESGAPFPQKC